MEGRKRKSYTRFTGTSATRRGESAPWTGEGKVSVGVFAGRVANEGAALGEETWQGSAELYEEESSCNFGSTSDNDSALKECFEDIPPVARDTWVVDGLLRVGAQFLFAGEGDTTPNGFIMQ